ncbi:hypothetical protein JCM33374_g3875 [Metschnikowia sp. JCM 33374]|nr:hypothetical protein JCM33374_g3875 [Metschnikowia sp. JCM 33374]
MSEGKKKSRITTACDFCRSKRVKCDGKLPICSNCYRNETNCTYFKKSKKRGLPTGYISELEAQLSAFQALLGLLILPTIEGGLGLLKEVEAALQSSQKSSCAENQSISAWKRSSLSAMFSENTPKNRPERRGSKSITKSVVHDPYSTFGVSVTNEDSEKITTSPLRSTKFSLSTSSEDQKTPNLMSPTTFEEFAFVDIDYASLLLNDNLSFSHDKIDPPGDHSLVALQYHGLSQKVSGFSGTSIYKYNSFLGACKKNPFRVGTIFNISSSIMAKKYSQIGQAKVPLEIFRFPKNVPELTDEYFAVYHPWMPMLDRKQILRQVECLSENREFSPDVQVCSIIALVWSIMALNHVDVDPQMAFSYARNAVLALECAPVTTIETIQGMILLGLYFYKAGEWDNAWVLVSSSSRMAIDVRLMRTSTQSNENSSQSDRDNFENTARERTWATVYSVNTLLAARMGRSPLVRATDWPTPKISEEGWEEWEPSKSFGTAEPFALESGNCLSIFNQFLKVIALLNTALTCNIDVEEKSNEMSDIPMGKKSVLDFFQKEMKKWKTELPIHCEIHNNQSALVAYLHMCSNMVWCTICVRLMHIKNDFATANGNFIEVRNSEYTNACVSNRRVLDSRLSSNIVNYPFMDYFILMCLNFPDMIQLNPLASAKHTSRMAQILELSSNSSIPYRITWDLYRLENGMDITDNEYTNVIESFGNNTQISQLQHAQVSDHQSPLQPFMADKDNSILPQILRDPSFSSLAKLEQYSRQRFLPYNKNAPKEELDLFMLDTDFAKSDSRLDKFMKNLGFPASGQDTDRNASAYSYAPLQQISMSFDDTNISIPGPSTGDQPAIDSARKREKSA